MRLRSVTVFAALCVLVSAGVVAAPSAGQPATALTTEAGEAAPDEEAEEAPTDGSADDLEAYWERRLGNAKQRILVARERAEKAEAEYSRARHDRNPRGVALEELRERHVAAEKELRNAEEGLPRLVEQARRAGVPPGVLRDYWEEAE